MSKGYVLVTGGCGYIGSHTIIDLIEHGYTPISVDNLSNASEDSLRAVAEITGQQVVNHRIDLCDREATRALFSDYPFVGVIHFAALKAVGESVEQPMRYYRNNLESLFNVVESMEETGVRRLIFSSSCSVYGNATALPVVESTPRQEAESPYARTKQIGEDVLLDYSKVAAAFSCVLLRYFNPAGAHPSALIGEAPSNPALNLVPVITETAIGKRSGVTVFGADYPTRDGSCIRDYIHIMDLARAHTLALDYLMADRQEHNYEIFNLGIGQGVSVLEAIAAFERVSGKKLAYQIGPRRAGDVVAVYANYEQAASRLGWQPKYDIDDIMATAWAWEQRRSATR
jgi:UDP-glucose 4-epimerase